MKGTYKGTAKQTLEVGVSVLHENGIESREVAAILTPQVVTIKFNEDGTINNSYRKYMEMIQQQQQQQQ